MLTRGFQGQWGGLGEDVSVGSRGVLEGPRYDETTQEVREEGSVTLLSASQYIKQYLPKLFMSDPRISTFWIPSMYAKASSHSEVIPAEICT